MGLTACSPPAAIYDGAYTEKTSTVARAGELDIQTRDVREAPASEQNTRKEEMKEVVPLATPYPVISVQESEGVFRSGLQFSIPSQKTGMVVGGIFSRPPTTLWYRSGARAGWKEKEVRLDEALFPGEYIGGDYLPEITTLPHTAIAPVFGKVEIVPIRTQEIQGIDTYTGFDDISQEDRIHPQTIHRPLVVFLPGSGHEPEGKYARFDPWVEYVERFVKETDALGDMVIVRYPSHKDIFENAANILKEIRKKYGPREIYIVAHSMGGLIAKAAGLLDRNDELIRAIITLGTPHHGSPLAIPKMIQEVFSHRVGADIYYALYTHSTSKFSALTENYSWKKMRKLYYESSYFYLPVGRRALFADGKAPEIPSVDFFYSVGIGIVPIIPLLFASQKLSSQDRFGIRCDNATIQNDEKLASILTKYSNGAKEACAFNMAEFLNGAWEDLSIQIPVITYAGTSDHTWKNQDFVEYINEMAKSDTDQERLAHSGLRWLGSVMAQMPAAQESDRTYHEQNDGMVTKISQENMSPHCTAQSKEGGETPPICLPKNYRTRYWKEYDHLDLTKGKEGSRDQYFSQWHNDIAMLEQERNTLRAPLPPLKQIRDMLYLRHSQYGTEFRVVWMGPMIPKNGIVTVQYYAYQNIGPVMTGNVGYESVFVAVGARWFPLNEEQMAP